MIFNKVLLAFLLPVALFSSCGKDDEDNPPVVPASSFDFIISGVSDVNVNRNKSVTLPLSVELKSGNQEAVTLSVSGLPQNVRDSFYAQSGTPTFGTALTLIANGAPIGSSEITLNAKSASGVTKDYKFKLNVTGAADCRDDIVGLYTVTNNCQSGLTQVFISKNPATSNTIFIELFPLVRDRTEVTVDCSDQKLSVVNDKFSMVTHPGSGAVSFTLNATGSFSGNTFTLNYTLNNETCVMTGARK